MYKMFNNLVPEYLASLCPNTNETATYTLRNRANMRTIPGRTTTYINSFLPKTIKDWNNLSVDLRSAVSLSSFKTKLKSRTEYKKNKLFAYGNSRGRVHHTRIRLGLSGLNSHRFSYHFISDRSCPECSFRVEDPCHYFFDCPIYTIARLNLLKKISNIVAPGVHCSLLLTNSIADRKHILNSFLFGFDDLDFGENTGVFSAVQEFIILTKRFK